MSWGSFPTMGLIGSILASLVKFFLKSSAIYWTVTDAGIILFEGLAVYDTQKIKAMALQGIGDEQAEGN
jgi:uncharacterized protein